MTITEGAGRRVAGSESAPAGGVLGSVLLLAAVALTVAAVMTAVLGQLEVLPAASLAFAAAALAGGSVVLDERGRRRPPAVPIFEERSPAPNHDHTGHDHASHDRAGHDGAGHAHDGSDGHRACAHGAAWRAGARHRHRLRWAFLLGLAVLAAEAIAAATSGSLALLSDVGHVLTDVAGLGLALGAIRLASAGSRDLSRTFGLYRLEVVAALANAFLLTGVAVYVLIEAAGRLRDPTAVPSTPMLIMAALGLAANLVAMLLLKPGASESLNVRGAYLEVMADAIGSVGLLGAAAAIGFTGWLWIDPVVGAAIGLWILPRTFRLAREALRVLVQAAPARVDMAGVDAGLRALDGVIDVHQLHVWTLTSGLEVASAHLQLSEGADAERVLGEASRLLRDTHGVTHVTLQVEAEPLPACLPTGW